MKRINKNTLPNKAKKSKGKQVELDSPPPAPTAPTATTLSTDFVKVLMAIKTKLRAPNRMPYILSELKKHYDVSADAMEIDGASVENIKTAFTLAVTTAAFPPAVNLACHVMAVLMFSTEAPSISMASADTS